MGNTYNTRSKWLKTLTLGPVSCAICTGSSFLSLEDVTSDLRLFLLLVLFRADVAVVAVDAVIVDRKLSCIALEAAMSHSSSSSSSLSSWLMLSGTVTTLYSSVNRVTPSIRRRLVKL